MERTSKLFLYLQEWAQSARDSFSQFCAFVYYGLKGEANPGLTNIEKRLTEQVMTELAANVKNLLVANGYVLEKGTGAKVDYEIRLADVFVFLDFFRSAQDCALSEKITNVIIVVNDRSFMVSANGKITPFLHLPLNK
jgi:hypothetical protein